MDTNIVSTTELQRNIKSVLDKLNDNNEPLIVVRDSKPKAVMMPYSEYKRLSSLEKEVIRLQMEKVWEKMRIINKNVSDKELNKDIEEAIKYAKNGR
ncbi:hypothetical protein A3D78_04510 [Candidatus Gottesmanbacteria bacterium RIFCSPHIGHO2_02_FULL_39_14]|uniref:Antitoxin n=3 Tax=Candidatus Gottesmaniibacteriota TaxID=1752720 RepID=A0A1F6A347_9BACT|nr:MAG: hypothetical protein A2153_01440 [Candidatus Gottesmanbacteria bacterium RBG_16_38_7b]OGG19110.1 MAG: hypothetical protein A3D78_04510 [Candidatus Gottesmanbacteria bacterium RIFCSPHIGHO2_02_FULL_39_14]OGG30864.1 MAG: hypothetical protein A3I51_01545 [Candidatus Gottesmanbacteria bacterium RIFCSPLOWO2_02_FULL_38_8]